MRRDSSSFDPRKSYWLVVLIFWAAVLPPGTGWASPAASQVTTALDTLDSWLQTSAQGAGWSAYLQNDTLRAQLAKGDQAEVAVVSAILAQYQSAVPGLDAWRFVAVRKALRQWSDQLAGQNTENLLAATRSLPVRVTAPTSSQLEAAQRDVRRALAGLNRFLRRSPARAAGWKAYLDWSLLEQQLAARQPDLKQLEAIVQRMSAPEEGLGLQPFKNVQRALRKYIDRQFAARNPQKVERRLEQISNELADSIEQLGSQATHRESLAVGARLDFVERYGEAEVLGRLVRQRFSHPNLVGYASEELLNAAVGRVINEPNQIRDNILGTRVSGHGVTEGEVRLALVPSPDRALLDVSMQGVNRANTIGRVRKVRIHSNSETQLSARTRIAFAPDAGMTAHPAQAWAESNTDIQRITVNSPFERMITRIAWKKAGQQKPAAEQEAARKARLRLERRFDDQIADMVGQANSKYHDQFRRPLVRQDLFPDHFQVASTEETIHLTAHKAFPDQLAAPTAAEPLPTGHDLALVIHESLINNVATHLLGGRKFTNQDADQAADSQQMKKLRKWVKVHNVGEPPEEKKDAPWEMTLANANPVTITFRDGKIKITVRGTRFLGIDQQEYKRPMSIWTEFAVSPRSDGGLWLTLEAWDVEATAVETGGKFQPADAPLRSKLRARLKDILGDQEAQQKLAVEFQPITPEGEAARVGQLVYTLCQPQKAWLTLAINRAD
ncbi:MAG: hypothetical protein GTO53_14420, partial [Planctomycetales bacterium]|nr:hypothetical protein [Planctomycetales bacterium]NIM10279.1 hypothetical protein [Planctomycetales bacterium]NIN09718.1 hypothetical protein [Planctomycetales bacterium]NIN78843.1 hypothetical protein [Planctomycetales bacterium]NIO36007.1 hypothetical protein [Planctomycetales bacterium]